MLHWINQHGVESLVIYYAFAAMVGSMPQLPPSAGFLAQWGAAFIHALSANIKTAAQILGVTSNDKGTSQG